MYLLEQFWPVLKWSPVVAIFIIVLVYLAGITRYWKVRGVKYIQPLMLFGNFCDVLMDKNNFAINVQRLYASTKERFVGIYLLTKPILMIRDPELIKRIFTIDAHKFTDNGLLTNNLLVLKGDRWRGTNKSIPKMFYDNMLNRKFDLLRTRFQQCLEREIIVDSVIDVRELVTRYTSASTAALVFSIDSFNNPNDEIYKIGQLLATSTRFSQLRSILSMAIPFIMDYFDYGSIDPQLEKLFRNMTDKIMKMRDLGKIVEFDYLQVLVQLRNCDQLSNDGKSYMKLKHNNLKYLTADEVFAKSFLFYIFVFHTTSSVTVCALYELAKNKEIQKELQSEIDSFVVKGATLTYNSLLSMKYLDRVLNETIRKYPTFPFIVRSTVTPYQIAKTEIVLDKNQIVFMPINAIHHDPKYYVKPENFNPDRFNADELKKRDPDTFYPNGNIFLDGAGWLRITCGMLQSKMVIFEICSKFNLDLAADDQYSNASQYNKLSFTRRNVK